MVWLLCLLNETIGLSATLLIVILRFLQGIAFGGETPTVMVSLYETAPVDKKGFYGSFYNPGALVGFLLGIILIICLNLTIGEQAIQRYGWRIMFAFSIIFIVILGYLRSKLVETSTVSNTNFTPVKITLKQDLFVILKIVLFISCGTAMYYNLLFHNSHYRTPSNLAVVFFDILSLNTNRIEAMILRLLHTISLMALVTTSRPCRTIECCG